MYIKIHNGYRKTVALCDSNLMEKRFEEGNKQIEIKQVGEKIRFVILSQIFLTKL